MTERKKDGNRELRQKAEHLIAQTNAVAKDLTGMSPEQIAGLVHELRVHQVELKMQNDELRRIQAELENARDRYLHLYDFAPTAYFTVAENGAVAEANLTAATLLDRSRKDLVGQMFSRFIYRDDQDIWYLHRKRLLETGNFQSPHVRFVKNDGAFFYVNLECMLAKENGSESKVIRIAATDVTRLKQAEQALQHSNATLEQRVVERTEVAEKRAKQLQSLSVELIEAEERERNRISVLLHEDVQQLLASARIQLQAAQQFLPPEAKLENVERLLEQSIVKSRNLSQELSPAMLNHSDLPTALQWLTRHMSEQFDLSVDLDIRNEQILGHMPATVFIFRAVQELLFNVVKHAGVKSARMVLSISGQFITVAVSDEGKGFDPAMLDHSKGGLGLLSLRERFSYFGGLLEIDSSPGNGTRINIAIPLSLSNIEVPHTEAIEQQTTAGLAQTQARDGDVRVLFVDDHKVMRQSLMRLVSGRPGIKIRGEAANGKEALELARLIRPDVILMDISMPVMDGIEATRRIKAELPDVRVVGLSMFEDEQSSRNMINAGADSFVPKTASSAELLKVIFGTK